MIFSYCNWYFIIFCVHIYAFCISMCMCRCIKYVYLLWIYLHFCILNHSSSENCLFWICIFSSIFSVKFDHFNWTCFHPDHYRFIFCIEWKYFLMFNCFTCWNHWPTMTTFFQTTPRVCELFFFYFHFLLEYILEFYTIVLVSFNLVSLDCGQIPNFGVQAYSVIYILYSK